MSQTNKKETLKAMIVDCLSKKTWMSAPEIDRTPENKKWLEEWGISENYRFLYRILKDMVKEGIIEKRQKNKNTPISTIEYKKLKP